MSKEGLKFSVWIACVLIGAFIVMSFMAGFERLRDWLSGGRP